MPPRSFAGQASCSTEREQLLKLARRREEGLLVPPELLEQALADRPAVLDWARTYAGAEPRNQQVSGWEIMKSLSQDGESLRLSIVWGGGPTVAELISLAESLPWPVGTRLKLSLRRKPEVDHRHPHIHHVQR